MRAVRLRELYLIGFSLLFVAAAARLEAEGQGGGNGRPPETVQEYQQWLKDTYLPKRQKQYDDKKKEVEDLVKEMSEAENGDSGRRFTNFHGADPGTVVQTHLDDSIKVFSELVFEEANDYEITTPQTLKKQQIKILGPARSTFKTCEVRSQLRPNPILGYADWGTCVNAIIPGPPWCNWAIIFTSSLVEYYYPGYKADVSEEPYQSYYYFKPVIEGGVMKANDLILYNIGKELVPDTINMVHAIARLQGAVQGYEFGATEAQGFPEAFDYLKKVDQNQRHTAPHLSRGYGRFIMDPINFTSLKKLHWMPHVMKAPLYGGDLPVSLSGTGEPDPGDPQLGGIYFSRFFFASMPWQKRFANLLMPFGPMRCLRNNKETGKTPKDLLLVPKKKDDTDACLRDIGEVFPVYDHRRQHITDGTYQGVWRALEIYRGIFPEGGSELGKTVDNEMASGDAWAQNGIRSNEKWISGWC